MPDARKRILISPLDWGLGHSTRCIPIISSLLRHDCEVIIAAEGASRALLEKEFPELQFLDLRGYRVKYNKNPGWFLFKLAAQFPGIIFRAYAEHVWLKGVVRKYNIDAVISDNRPGLFHKAVSSIYITHQLNIQTKRGYMSRLANSLHFYFIDKFNECWVPDFQDENNLAGDLSHPAVFPKIPVKYIGALSRFEKTEQHFFYNLAVLLSGPEPQRSIFEELLLKELENYTGKVLFVRGLPGKNEINKFPIQNISLYNHLSSADLNAAILQSELVIGRCGYSTVMDLVKLNKNAVLVPTPGQTEQEYLARYLNQRGIFYCIDQQRFSLHDAVKNSKDFFFADLPTDTSLFENVLKDSLLGTG